MPQQHPVSKFLSSAVLWVVITQLSLGSLPRAAFPQEASQDFPTPQVRKITKDLGAHYGALATTIEDVVGGLPLCNPFDAFCTLNQDLEEEAAKRKIDAEKIHVRFYAGEGLARTEVARHERFGLLKATDPRFSARNLPNFKVPASMELWFQDRRIERINLSIRQATFWGDYFVFVEENSFIPETGVQNLRFIDLSEFGSLIGKEELPVFRIPVKTDAEASRLTIEDGHLVVGPQRISPEVMKDLAAINLDVYHVAVNLADPDFYERAANDIAELIDAFKSAASKADQQVRSRAEDVLGGEERFADFLTKWIEKFEDMRQFHEKEADVRKLGNRAKGAESLVAGTNSRIDPEKLKEALPEIKRFLNDYHDATMPEKRLQDASAALKAQRKLFARVQLLLGRLALPQPSGTSKLREALVYVASGLGAYRRGDRLTGDAHLKEGVLQLIHHPLTKGAGMATAAVLGAHHPVETSQFLLRGLEVTKTFYDIAMGTAYNWTVGNANVAWLSLTEMAKGFRPSVLWDAYVADGKWSKTLHGLHSVFTFVLTNIGLPHVVINTLALALDLKHTDFSKYVENWENRDPLRKISGATRQLIPWFIERQAREKAHYYATLADDQASRLTPSDLPFDAEKQALEDRFLEEMKERENRGFTALYRKVSQLNCLTWVQKLRDKFGETGLYKFGDAIGSFAFSFASLTHTFAGTMKIWNYAVYSVRTFVWNPLSLLPAYLLYPEFFFTTVSEFGRLKKAGSENRPKNRENSITIPTEQNGGTRHVGETLYTMFLEDREVRDRLYEWEEKITDVEFEIQQVSLREAYNALLDYLVDSKDTRKLVKSGGIHSLADKVLTELPSNARLYHRHYFNELFQRSMKTYLSRLAEQASSSPITEATTPAELKKMLLGQTESLAITSAGAAQVVEGVLHADRSGENAIARAAEHAVQSKADPKVMMTNARYKTLLKLNPAHSREMKRMALTHNALKDPKLVQRVVLKQVSKYLIDIPLEVAWMFVLFAGATTAELIPIQPEQFSDTSWNYLSTNVFKGWLAGLMSTFLANAWGDLQGLVRQSDQFGVVPKATERSYLSWFYHHGWKHKENTLMANWRDMNDVVLANVKAYLSLGIVTSLFVFGRFDIDQYVLGYLIALGTPHSAFGTKIENAFEHSVDFILKDVPEAIRDRPRVLEWVSVKKQKARLTFNLWYRLVVENPLGNFISYIQYANAPGIGPRALARNLFGNTPTNYLDHGLDAAKPHIEEIPVVGKAAGKAVEFCDMLFTRNYPAGDPPVGPKGK